MAEEYERRDEYGEPDRSEEPTQVVHDGHPNSEAVEYQWHTGQKRDHGGEDAIEIIDLV